MGRSYLTLGSPLLFIFGEEDGERSGGLLLPGGLRSEQQGTPDPILCRPVGTLLPEDKSKVFFGTAWVVEIEVGSEWHGQRGTVLGVLEGSEVVQRSELPASGDKISRFPVMQVYLGQKS